jgi:hypothetical protein
VEIDPHPPPAPFVLFTLRLEATAAIPTFRLGNLIWLPLQGIRAREFLTLLVRDTGLGTLVIGVQTVISGRRRVWDILGCLVAPMDILPGFRTRRSDLLDPFWVLLDQ